MNTYENKSIGTSFTRTRLTLYVQSSFNKFFTITSIASLQSPLASDGLQMDGLAS